MVSAQDFRAKFIDAYDEARENNRNEWHAIWNDTGRWSGLMMVNQESVIRTTAKRLGLRCCPREPLSFDAIFVGLNTSEWDWFPIVVAVEHENNPRTFEIEIRKLLSLRCPLKVGITYVISSDTRDDPAELRKKIAEQLAKLFDCIKDVTLEDPNTQYLFLIGSEPKTEPYQLQWHYLEFDAKKGPGANFSQA